MARGIGSPKKGRGPKYRRQRRQGKPDLAFIEVGGQRLYLGEYGTEVSRAEYTRLVAELAAAGGSLTVARSGTTVVEVVARFWEFAQSYYRRRDGTATSEVANYRAVLKVLRELYGHTRAKEFGPLSLKAVRAELIRRDLSRSTVNSMVNRVRRVFRWAAEEELVDAAVYQALQTVRGLARGRSPARETEPVRPVAIEDVEAVLPHLSTPLRAVVRVQLLTAGRPGEILCMRRCDIDQSGEIWCYRPESHKTSYRGRERKIYRRTSNHS